MYYKIEATIDQQYCADEEDINERSITRAVNNATARRIGAEIKKIPQVENVCVICTASEDHESDGFELPREPKPLKELRDDTYIGHVYGYTIWPKNLDTAYRAALQRGWRMRWRDVCNERPPCVGEYLVQHSDHGCHMIAYFNGDQFRRNKNTVTITHWMPLPEPEVDRAK